MSGSRNFLVTIVYGSELIRVALKCHESEIPDDCWMCPMEPENRAAIAALLPEHVRSMGPIVEVTRDLFGVVVTEVVR